MHEKQIKQILIDNGFEYLIPIFEQNHLLDSHALSMMSDSDYQSIGVSVLGDRKKLLYLFQNVADYEDEEDEEEDYDDDGEEDDYEEGDDDEEEEDDDYEEDDDSDEPHEHWAKIQDFFASIAGSVEAFSRFFDIIKEKNGKENENVAASVFLIGDEVGSDDKLLFSGLLNGVTLGDNEFKLKIDDTIVDVSDDVFNALEIGALRVATSTEPPIFATIAGSIRIEEKLLDATIIFSSFPDDDNFEKELETLNNFFRENI